MENHINEIKLDGPAGVGATLRGQCGTLVTGMFFIIIVGGLFTLREISLLHIDIIQLESAIFECQNEVKTMIELLQTMSKGG